MENYINECKILILERRGQEYWRIALAASTRGIPHIPRSGARFGRAVDPFFLGKLNIGLAEAVL